MIKSFHSIFAKRSLGSWVVDGGKYEILVPLSRSFRFRCGTLREDSGQNMAVSFSFYLGGDKYESTALAIPTEYMYDEAQNWFRGFIDFSANQCDAFDRITICFEDKPESVSSFFYVGSILTVSTEPLTF